MYRRTRELGHIKTKCLDWTVRIARRARRRELTHWLVRVEKQSGLKALRNVSCLSKKLLRHRVCSFRSRSDHTRTDARKYDAFTISLPRFIARASFRKLVATAARIGKISSTLPCKHDCAESAYCCDADCIACGENEHTL